MKRVVSEATAIFICVGLLAFAGCGSSAIEGISGADDAGVGGSSGNDSGAVVGSGGTVGLGGSGGAGGAGSCRLVGATCASHGDCCTASCDPQTNLCVQSLGACRSAGSACTIPQDCCTFVCSGGTCGATLCTSDGQACSSSAQCCGGVCGATGVCTPLNPSCRTSGNACSTHGDCCSRVCRAGTCAGAVSFCTQTGDTCASDFECCGGLCTKAQGATVGVCRQPSAPGAPGCTVAGEVCGGGAADDGGFTTNDAGVPSCGGSCCSRSCAPYRTGVMVCQPPSGCRPTGEVCGSDADCCGFGGQQGVTGTGSCSKANASDPVGRCDNGNACRPAGAICKLASMSCNAENNCCSGNVNQNPFVCQQDILGVPRCTMAGETCVDAGSKSGLACATSADCCGLPCVPNPSFTTGGGTAPFVCGGVCAGNGGTCTSTADCCPGLPCATSPGSTRGICGNPQSGDAGLPDGAAPPVDGSTTDAPADAPAGTPGTCAEYGQICSTATDCCNGVPCNGGRCVVIIR